MVGMVVQHYEQALRYWATHSEMVKVAKFMLCVLYHNLNKKHTCQVLYLQYTKPTALARHCMCVCAQSLLSSPALCNPMDCILPSSSVHGDSPDKNTGMGCHFLLQGIFLTQGLGPTSAVFPALQGRFCTTGETQLDITCSFCRWGNQDKGKLWTTWSGSQAKRQSPVVSKASAYFSTLILYEEFRMG